MKTYEPSALTNLQVVEGLLSEIHKRKKNVYIDDVNANPNEEHYMGRLGAHITFYGTKIKDQTGQFSEKCVQEKIKLLDRGQGLVNFNIKHSMTTAKLECDSIEVKVIQVFSPRYSTNQCLTKENLATKKLQIFHAPDENANSLINNICDAIAYSKACMSYRKEFGSYLNLATRLANQDREL